jgi:hypothetical protein
MDEKLITMHLLAGKTYGEEATCGTKVDYKSEGTAEKSAIKLTQKYQREMEHYPCFFCKGWHVGRKLTSEEIEGFTECI